MAVITIDRKDFCNLVGKDIPMNVIEDRIPMMGVGWEGAHGDTFDVEVFPNRPDMLSVEGLARTFSAFMNVKTGLRNYEVRPSEYLVKVDQKVESVRPFFVSCVIKEVKFTDDFIKSIMQLQEKLHITHCKKRKKVAIGLHDLDKIRFPVVYTTKDPDFKFVPLDETEEMSLREILEETPKGKEYAWILEKMKEYPILIDSKNMVLSMPPIINSIHTKIDENTKNVFVDITATDEKTADEVLNIIVTAFADRGGKLYKVKIKHTGKIIQTPNLSPRMMGLKPYYVNKILGLNLTTYEIIEYLQMMGFDAAEVGNQLEILIPAYRTDIMHAIDLVEDVAIAYGYDRFEPEIPNIATIGEEDEMEIFSRRIRSLLVGYGLEEVITFILTNKENLFRKMNMEEREVAETANPKTEEYSVLRNWLLPSLIEVLSRNKHHEFPQKLFEVGDVIEIDPTTDTGTRTMKRLAIVLSHAKANFSETKSLFESISNNFGVSSSDYKVEETNCPCYTKGRAAKFTIGGKTLARFGEINPVVLENWDLEMPTAGGEICVELLFSQIKM